MNEQTVSKNSLAISFINNHPPRAHSGICTKNLPPPWGFCIQAFAWGGGGFVGEAPEGWAFVWNDVCHFWNFHYNGKNWRLTQHFGVYLLLWNFICSSKNYSIPDWTKANKEHVKIIFIPVIALSYPFFCSKLEQTLHKHQEQHSWHAGKIFLEKGVSKYLKIPFYVLESFPINCVISMVLVLKFSVTNWWSD